MGAGVGVEVAKWQVTEKLDPRKVFLPQECHKCHGRGRYKCSGCHGACMVSLVWPLVSVVWAEEPPGAEGWAGGLTVAPQASHSPWLDLRFPTCTMGRLDWVVSIGLFHLGGL